MPRESCTTVSSHPGTVCTSVDVEPMGEPHPVGLGPGPMHWAVNKYKNRNDTELYTKKIILPMLKVTLTLQYMSISPR